MNLQLDSLTEEIISISMGEAGMPFEKIEKCIEAIKYSMKETNYTHNSVSDSNFYAAEARKENETISRLNKEIDSNRKQAQSDLEETIREKNRIIYRLQDRISDLEKQLL